MTLGIVGHTKFCGIKARGGAPLREEWPGHQGLVRPNHPVRPNQGPASPWPINAGVLLACSHTLIHSEKFLLEALPLSFLALACAQVLPKVLAQVLVHLHH